MLSRTYYAYFSAGIIGAPLLPGHVGLQRILQNQPVANTVLHAGLRMSGMRQAVGIPTIQCKPLALHEDNLEGFFVFFAS